MYRGDFMNGASMLGRFYALNPRRRVIFLNCENERYSGEYLRLKLDILTEALIALGVEFELSENEIFLFGKDIQARLLFE